MKKVVILATIFFIIFIVGCKALDPVEQAKADAIRIQAEADKQVQIMAANQDAADRTQARNSGNDWMIDFIIPFLFCQLGIVMFILSSFLFTKGNNKYATNEAIMTIKKPMIQDF